MPCHQNLKENFMLRCRHSWWAVLYIRTRSCVLNCPVFCNMGIRYWSYSGVSESESGTTGKSPFSRSTAIVCGSSEGEFVDSSATEVLCDLPWKKTLGIIALYKKHYVFSELRTLVFACVSGYVSRTEKPALFLCLAGVRMSECYI